MMNEKLCDVIVIVGLARAALPPCPGGLSDACAGKTRIRRADRHTNEVINYPGVSDQRHGAYRYWPSGRVFRRGILIAEARELSFFEQKTVICIFAA